MPFEKPETNSPWTWIKFSIATSVLALLTQRLFGPLFADSDIPYYLDIAAGNTARVLQPFASRQLGALVARWLAGLLHVGIRPGFIIEGLISLFALTAGLGWLLQAFSSDLWVLVAIGGTAFWAETFNGVGLPDLWFSALLIGFILSLHRQKWLLASMILLPLYLSREATLLVLVSLLVSGWRELRVVGRIIAVSASALGMAIVRILIPPGTPNKERLGELTYMVGKIPWNFLKNVVGLPPWNDLNKGNCVSPGWDWKVHFGSIHRVGLCSYRPDLPLGTLRLCLDTFGVLPVILVFAWRHRRNAIWRQNALLRFCLIYGSVSLLLAPELGSSVSRLLGYGWPLFFIAVPLLLASTKIQLTAKARTALVALQLTVSWSIAIRPFALPVWGFDVCLLLFIGGADAVAWHILEKATRRQACDI
jgi:hypothetical protein